MYQEGRCTIFCTHVKSSARKVKTSSLLVLSAIYLLLLQEINNCCIKKMTPNKRTSNPPPPVSCRFFENLHPGPTKSSIFSDLKVCLRVNKRPNCTVISTFAKSPTHVWTRPYAPAYSVGQQVGSVSTAASEFLSLFIYYAATPIWSSRAQQRVWRSVSCSPCPLPLLEHQKEEDPRRVFEEPIDTPLWVVNWQMLKPHNSIQAGGASFSSAFVPLPLVFLAAPSISFNSVLVCRFALLQVTFCSHSVPFMLLVY